MSGYDLRVFQTGNHTRRPDRSETFTATDDGAALAHLRVFAERLPSHEQVWLWPSGGDRSIGSEQGSAS